MPPAEGHGSPAAMPLLDKLPAAVKALLAQTAGWALAALALGSGTVPALAWVLVLIQALAAAVAASALRSERWWLAIHLGFSPLLLLALGLGIAPGWYLGAFVVLAAIYWTTFRTRVPLYLSNHATATAVAGLLAQDRPLRVLDLGSGTGSLLLPLARRRPDCTFTGIETAPAPYLVSRIRARGLDNLHLTRGDFFAPSWAGYDLIYSFLSPVPMKQVWDKARREMDEHCVLVSNSFTIPGVEPAAIIDVDDARSTRLYVYYRHCAGEHSN